MARQPEQAGKKLVIGGELLDVMPNYGTRASVFLLLARAASTIGCGAKAHDSLGLSSMVCRPFLPDPALRFNERR
ncbi:hypothetical protein [Salinibacterium sp.]|uniref:hypothetical protein n=1 Tax=Salinibacterium sp. TaxID=1915057 RepID=UPI00286A40EA|nr:hypothetical protein [Salinibacterium sp.]